MAYMKHFKFIALASLCGVSACSTMSSGTALPAQSSEPPDTITVSGELSARELGAGECGLFIWAGEERRFVMFSQNGQGAVLAQDRQEICLLYTSPSPRDA